MRAAAAAAAPRHSAGTRRRRGSDSLHTLPAPRRGTGRPHAVNQHGKHLFVGGSEWFLKDSFTPNQATGKALCAAHLSSHRRPRPIHTPHAGHPARARAAHRGLWSLSTTQLQPVRRGRGGVLPSRRPRVAVVRPLPAQPSLLRLTPRAHYSLCSHRSVASSLTALVSALAIFLKNRWDSGWAKVQVTLTEGAAAEKHAAAERQRKVRPARPPSTSPEYNAVRGSHRCGKYWRRRVRQSAWGSDAMSCWSWTGSSSTTTPTTSSRTSSTRTAGAMLRLVVLAHKQQQQQHQHQAQQAGPPAAAHGSTTGTKDRLRSPFTRPAMSPCALAQATEVAATRAVVKLAPADCPPARRLPPARSLHSAHWPPPPNTADCRRRC